MAYNLAQRDEIALTDTTFRHTVAGALVKHARYLMDSGVTGKQRLVAGGLLARVMPEQLDSTARLMIFYPTMDNLADISAVSDNDAMTLVATIWPLLVTAWVGDEE